MPNVRDPQRVFIQAVLILGALTASSGLSPVAGADEQAHFQQRAERAKAALEERMQARFTAGWIPKSRNEQLVTRLSRTNDMSVLKQDQAYRRAAFEAARAEVYLQMARDYTRIGSYRRGYLYSYAQDRVTGAIRPVVRTDDFWVLDPWAARLSAHFGSKAARSKGIAAAQEYHANTYYERRLRNTSTRIAALQRQISLKAQLAQGP